jgi:hypothetical protein
VTPLPFGAIEDLDLDRDLDLDPAIPSPEDSFPPLDLDLPLLGDELVVLDIVQLNSSSNSIHL